MIRNHTLQIASCCVSRVPKTANTQVWVKVWVNDSPKTKKPMKS